jgi:hypothetical protein
MSHRVHFSKAQPPQVDDPNEWEHVPNNLSQAQGAMAVDNQVCESDNPPRLQTPAGSP